MGRRGPRREPESLQALKGNPSRRKGTSRKKDRVSEQLRKCGVRSAECGEGAMDEMDGMDEGGKGEKVGRGKGEKVGRGKDEKVGRGKGEKVGRGEGGAGMAGQENVIDVLAGVEVYEAPVWMPADGREAWDELGPVLSGLGLLTRADVYAFALLCYTWSAWVASRAEVEADGSRIELSEKGRAFPSAASINERCLYRDLMRGLAEFGATPSGRTGLRVEVDDKRSKLQLWVEQAKKRREERKKRGVRGGGRKGKGEE